MKISLTGIKPSNSPHIGNYLGMFKPALELQKQYSCIYMIVDLHALTTNKDSKKMRQYNYDLVATWLALGLDTDKHILFRQSDVPYVCELAWYLSCVTGLGLLQKAHAYKDAKNKLKDINHGIFYYPVLMAADILLYEADVIPVGKDQKQHVEMARDMASSFNAIYGEVLKLPTPLIQEEVELIPGLDGQKMSKSYNNTVSIFSSEKELKKSIMSIKTDSSTVEEPKNLDGTLLAQLYKHFSNQNEYNELRDKLAKGGFGWGHAKEELFQKINSDLKQYRENYFKYREDHKLLDENLKKGKEKAEEIAINVITKVRKAIGVR